MSPDANMQLSGSMRDHLDQILLKIKDGKPFGLIRPSDGEYKILRGESITNCDKWTFTKGGMLQAQLLESIQTNDSNLYIGIPCNSCNKPWNCTPEIYHGYTNVFKVPSSQRTYANIFGNSNWKPFIEFLKSYDRGLYLITSGSILTNEINIKERHIIDPFLVNNWDAQGKTESDRLFEFISNKSGELILFSAGPLSKVWIPQCMRFNPKNMYLDVGAAIDIFTKGQTNRHYTDPAHPFSKESCVFRSDEISSVGNISSNNKNLIYVCISHNIKYIKLLELLIRSMRRVSDSSVFDFLIITTVEYEASIRRLAKKLDQPILIMTKASHGLFEAACARLSIFDYKNIRQYEKILYLDTDIIIMRDISVIFKSELENKVYGCEQGSILSDNFGGQFFDRAQVDVLQTGINTGTLLFRNTPEIKGLFKRIQEHIRIFLISNETIPYCLDQPFVNYHLIKDGIFDNNKLTQHIALFETECVPNNISAAIICHFSYPIGDFFNKRRRMVKFLGDSLSPWSVGYISHLSRNFWLFADLSSWRRKIRSIGPIVKYREWWRR